SHRLRRSSFKGVILAAFAATSLTACSLHPIPDDVSPIPTEAIVMVARCELRLGLIRMVNVWLYDDGIQGTLRQPHIPGERAEIIPGTLVRAEFVGEKAEFKKLTDIFKTESFKKAHPKDWQTYQTDW